MDMSKAYNCITDELLIAKLEYYDLDETRLWSMLDYLSNRKQRTEIASGFSSWYDMSTVELQGSILRPLLLNIFINKSSKLEIRDF